MDSAGVAAPTFEDLVAQTVNALPLEVQRELRNVAFVVEEHPRTPSAREQAIRIGADLLGLYEGVPRPARSVMESGIPDKITIFGRACAEVSTREQRPLVDVIRETVWHEVGHHLGLDEHALRELGLG